MKKLQFDYWMEITYTEPATECHYTIKCLPKDTDMQKIEDLKIEMMPQSNYQKGEDSFGNQMVYDNLYWEHNRFGFHVHGVVKTGKTEDKESFVGIYRYSHGLNKAGTQIKKYYNELMQKKMPSENKESAYTVAFHLMKNLYQDFIYEKYRTNIYTSAEDAWKMGCGVCQDYAHILIALCHLAHIPARYVAGMMVGEGFSHAWVEVFCDDHWIGLDPTNGCAVDDSYIRINIGRDANDCLINKGIVKGGGMQTQTVRVCVEEFGANKGETFYDKNSSICGTSCR